MPESLQLEKNLNDDYVKFFGLLVKLFSTEPFGIACLITNHAFLDNPTLRGLRWKLLNTFPQIRVLDLHGNLKKKEEVPENGDNENVFDIQQGVSVTTLIREPSHDINGVSHADLWGSRDSKYRALLDESLTYESIGCYAPWFKFCTQDELLGAEFRAYVSISEVMPFTSTGIKTHRDAFVIDFDENTLRKRIEDFRSTLSDSYIETEYGLADTYGWKLKEARKRIRQRPDWEASFQLCLYRPFDTRHIYYHPDLVELPRTECMRNLSGGRNIALLATRQVTSPPFNHVLVTRLVNEMKTCSHDRGTNCFPLYLESSNGSLIVEGRHPNISGAMLEKFVTVVGREVSPEQLLGYIYAICHSPVYRVRYAEFLKTEFPRIPVGTNADLFSSLCILGLELVQLHLMESADPATHTIRYEGILGTIDAIIYSDGMVYLSRERSYGFFGVPEQVWNYCVGGYQVCHKWLKDRKGRTLSEQDIAHYSGVVLAISESIRIANEIDELIEHHGGWPGAFVESA